jgi:TolB-like protein/Tfp pilus assembly protein PilF
MPNREILDSWKEIAAHLGRSVKTCQRLEKELGLPVHRLEESPRARVFAYKDEIDRWIEKTQHSERKTFLNRLRLKNIAIPVLILIVAIAILIWQFFPQKTSAPYGQDKISIAVLPFEDLSPQKDKAYFCDGFAESIITALTKLKDLRITAPNSSFLLRGKDRDVQEIGSKLNVKSVLRGSVQTAGTKVRITAQLIDVSDGSLIWSEQYSRELENIFAIQDDITLAIVDTLKVKLLTKDRIALTKRYTENVEAYNLYLKGVHFIQKFSPKGFMEATNHFQQALQKDPNYALAYFGLGTIAVTTATMDRAPPHKAYPKATEYIQKALELDDALGEAHAILGYVLAFYDWNWEEAENEFNLALELNPSFSYGHTWYSSFLLVSGRYDKAISEAKRALELNPLSSYVNVGPGRAYFFAGQYDKALEELRTALKIYPDDHQILYFLGGCFEAKAMYQKAIEKYEKVVDITEGTPFWIMTLANAYHRVGSKDKAEKLFESLEERSKDEYIAPICFYYIHLARGKEEKAFEWLERACEERDSFLLWMRIHPLDSKRIPEKPEYQALFKKYGLEPLSK